MRIIRQQHEFDLNEAVPFIGKVVKLVINCPTTDFPDASSTSCHHHHLGTLVGVRQDIQVETAGPSTERTSELVFEFDGGRHVVVVGASEILLDDLAARVPSPEERPVAWPVRHG